jgi:hypothetical protein
MSSMNQLVVSYLAAWNERDPDAHRRGVGHAEIDALIAAAQEMFPGYRLNLVSGIGAHGAHARFSWAAGGSAEAPLYLAGTDFVTLAEDGRALSVVGFTDAAPAAG